MGRNNILRIVIKISSLLQFFCRVWPSYNLPNPIKFNIDQFKKNNVTWNAPFVSVKQKYLLYASHSGFSNQLFGLARAFLWANITDRILIIPPILSHFALAWGPDKCSLARTKYLIRRAFEAYESNNAVHGTFQALFILNESFIFDNFGLRFQEWAQFMQARKNESKHLWKYYYHNIDCSKKNMQGILKEIHPFEKDEVLVIGTAFYSRIQKKLPETQFQEMYKYFLKLPVSTSISSFAEDLIYSAYRNETFVSIHIRSGDNLASSEQKHSRIAFRHVMQILPNVSANGVFIASDLQPQSKISLFAALEKKFQVVHELESLISGRDKKRLEFLGEKLHVHPSLLAIILDQYICSRGSTFIHSPPEIVSTFSNLIKNRWKMQHPQHR